MLPLEGIRVLDLTRFMPGQYPTMLLGEMGADVIKVEAPGSRVAILGMVFGMPPTAEAMPRWLAVNALDRNKRSICLNLRLEKAREIFYRLVVKSDVVLEDNRPGVMNRLGVDYETVKGKNPRIIYCSMTGYGQDGPYSMLPARDLACIAMSGILGVINEGGSPPIVPGVKIADLAGAMYNIIGILLALAAREKTGRGQFVDISMTDAALSWLTAPLMLYFASGKVPDRNVVLLTGKWPSYNIYQTKDGKFIAIATREPHIWQNLCKKLGREDLLPYRIPEGEKSEEIISIFKGIFATKTRDEWFDELKEMGVAKIYELDELTSDPQLVHRQMFIEIDHPLIGKVKQVANPIKLSDTPGKIKSPAPLPGQHTKEILRELGYSLEDIENLRKDSVVE